MFRVPNVWDRSFIRAGFALCIQFKIESVVTERFSETQTDGLNQIFVQRAALPVGIINVWCLNRKHAVLLFSLRTDCGVAELQPMLMKRLVQLSGSVLLFF